MEIRERAIKEINSLSASSLLSLYDVILSLKSSDRQVQAKSQSSAYVKVREVLKNLNGSLSDDINSMRQERI